MKQRLMQAIVLFGSLALSGCSSMQSTLDPHGPAADRIAHLSWFMTILFLVITVVMWGLVGFAFYRRRGTLAMHEPITTGGGEVWIAVGGIAVPLLVLTILFVLGLQLLRDFPIHGMHGSEHHAGMMQSMKPDILIIGHQWWWQIEYLDDDPSQRFTTANELHIPINRPVNIQVESNDVMHSFWIPALHGKVDLIPGQSNYIRLEADSPGEYLGQCAEFCGAEHARMHLLAIAQPPEEFAAWREQQLKPATEPTTEDAQEGQKLFLSSSCSMCHQIRGTISGGRVAPDLTHIGSRSFIAAGSYQNNDAYLTAWITHAQSLKPEAQMPDLTQFSGEQLHDLVTYLRQLQ